MKRRDFIKTCAALGLTSAFPVPRLIAANANETVRVGCIGLGGRGGIHSDVMNGLQNVKVVALCDPDSDRLAARNEKFHLEKSYTDMRRIIEDPEIDAVTIATCNHWHCLAGIWAMQAGKDVYVEKPLSLTFWEGEQLLKAAQKYNRICQVGTQSRSDVAYRHEVQKFLHEEKALGKILFVRANRFFPRRPIGKRAAPLEIPASINYNLWLGPAQDQPIFRSNLHYDWHWMWNTGNGETGNWGSHLLDRVRSDVFQDKVIAPRRILSLGGRLGPEDAGETPNTMLTWFDTGSVPVVLTFSGVEPPQRRHYTGRFEGPDSGYLIVCEGGTIFKEMVDGTAFDKDGKEIRKFVSKEFGVGTAHFQNFIDAVRTRKREDLNCDIQVGFDDSMWYNSANVAYRLGKEYSKDAFLDVVGSGKTAGILPDLEQHVSDIGTTMDSMRLSPVLELDAQTHRFVGESGAAANALMEMRPGREKFVVPEV